MSIVLRSRREIDLMHDAGNVVAQVLSQISGFVKPGITTKEVDDLAVSVAHGLGAKCLFKGVRSPYAKRPFPGAICASINEQVVHGIPSDKVVLSDGDIFSVDFGVKLNGYCGDSAVTLAIGNVSEEKQRLMDVTQDVLQAAVDNIAPGVKWSEVARKMQLAAESAGFSVVRDLVGHGIGTDMHCDPQVPNYVSRELIKNDFLLKEGMVLAVEPMINVGKYGVKTLKDGWTVVTVDGKPSAHFEHTIAVVGNGCEVLTARE